MPMSHHQSLLPAKTTLLINVVNLNDYVVEVQLDTILCIHKALPQVIHVKLRKLKVSGKHYTFNSKTVLSATRFIPCLGKDAEIWRDSPFGFAISRLTSSGTSEKAT